MEKKFDMSEDILAGTAYVKDEPEKPEMDEDILGNMHVKQEIEPEDEDLDGSVIYVPREKRDSLSSITEGLLDCGYSVTIMNYKDSGYWHVIFSDIS